MGSLITKICVILTLFLGTLFTVLTIVSIVEKHRVADMTVRFPEKIAPPPQVQPSTANAQPIAHR